MYILIITMFVLIFIFDRVDKKEHFHTPYPYCAENKEGVKYGSAVNLGNKTATFSKNRNFSNFGGFSEDPHRRLCPDCDQHENCSAYPYDDSNDYHMSVCTRCHKQSHDNYLKFHDTKKLYGWQVGRPRQCIQFRK